MRRSLLLVVIALALASATHSSAAQTSARSMLAGILHLDSATMSRSSRGEIVTRVLKTNNERDIVVMSMVTLASSRDDFIDRQRLFARLARAPERTGFGIFTTPASSADLGGLITAPSAVRSLKHCRPGDCDFKLPASAMSEVRVLLESAGDSAVTALARFTKNRLAAYVNTYRSDGRAGMIVYDDQAESVGADDAFRDLVRQPTMPLAQLPELREYLVDYPHQLLEGAGEAMYWVRDSVAGLRPTIVVSQLVVYSPPGQPGLTIIATKQLLADHYFEASLDLMFVFDHSAGSDTDSIDVIMVRHRRFDSLSNHGILRLRRRAAESIRALTEREMRRLKG
jgi:hypothetical protein